MILGIYETVTGCNQGSITAWAEHVAGASALLRCVTFWSFLSCSGFLKLFNSICCLESRQLARYCLSFPLSAILANTDRDLDSTDCGGVSNS
jgi:hypothetical protein